MSCLGFDDIDLIFKVTVGFKLPNLKSQSACVHHLMNWLADFNQICMDITLGHEELIQWSMR